MPLTDARLAHSLVRATCLITLVAEATPEREINTRPRAIAMVTDMSVAFNDPGPYVGAYRAFDGMVNGPPYQYPAGAPEREPARGEPVAGVVLLDEHDPKSSLYY